MTPRSKLILLREYYRNVLRVTLSLEDIRVLQRVAGTLQREATKLCNGQIDQNRWEGIEYRCFMKLQKIFMSTSVTPGDLVVNGDPRGYCLTLIGPNRTEVCPQEFN